MRFGGLWNLVSQMSRPVLEDATGVAISTRSATDTEIVVHVRTKQDKQQTQYLFTLK